MIEKQDKKVLLSNFTSLSTLQIANYMLPLITFPYLIRTLGIENFGLLAFATAFILFFQNIIEYGFNLTATKEISKNRDNIDNLSLVVNSVLQAKLLLFVGSFIIITIIIFSFDKFSENWQLYYFVYLATFGELLFPLWFFQGMEKMKYIMKLTILARILYSISIFIFIQESNDYILVPILNAFSFIFLGIASLYILKKDFMIIFKIESIKNILKVYKEGWYIFLSKISVYFYASINIVILGFFFNNEIVGYYAIAEKIISVLLRMPQTINQTIYPYLVKSFEENKVHFKSSINKFLILIILSMSFIIIPLEYFAKDIIYIISGSYIEESIQILKILLITLLLRPLGSFFTQYFVIVNRNNTVLKVTIVTMIINFIVVFPMIYVFDFYGLAYTVLAVQVSQVIINLYNMKMVK